MYLNRADRRAIKKRFKNDIKAIHAAAKKGDELAERWVAVQIAKRFQPTDKPARVLTDEWFAREIYEYYETLVSART